MEVNLALADGKPVKVESEAVLEDGGIYLAVEIEFELDEQSAEFEGRVVSVALGEVEGDPRTFTLTNGRVYTVTTETLFDETGSVGSLEAMFEALAAGDKVIVVGLATKDASGAWLVSALTANIAGG